MDMNGRPADYDDLVRNYFGMVRSIVAKGRGVDPQDVDDMAQEILLRMVEWRSLAYCEQCDKQIERGCEGVHADHDVRPGQSLIEMYAPNKMFMTPSGVKKARFPTLLRTFVKKFLRGISETHENQKTRQIPLTRLEEPTIGGATVMEVYAPVAPDEIAEAEHRLDLESVYAYLGTIHVSEEGYSTAGTHTLAEVLAAMRADVAGYGRFTRRRVAEALGVSDQSITEWVLRLREELVYLGFPEGEYVGENVA